MPNISVYLSTVGIYHIEGYCTFGDCKDEIEIQLLDCNGGVLYSVTATATPRQDICKFFESTAAYEFMFKGYFCGWVNAIKFVGGNMSNTIAINFGSTRQYEFLCAHNDDFMFKFLEGHHGFIGNLGGAVEYYINDAIESAGKLQELCSGYFKKPQKLKLLEFASGYGRVTRQINRERFDITSCDIHEGAIKYVKKNIKVNTILSSTNPDEFTCGGGYDVVFALSFFTHMPDRTFGKWIKCLYEQLAPGGLLIFTAHGRIANAKHWNYKLKNGYAFYAESEQGDLETSDYGTTVTLKEYIDRVCEEYINNVPCECREGFFHVETQDVYVVQKNIV